MHLLRDVVIADGTVLAASAYDRIVPGKPRMVLTGAPETIAEGALCTTQVTQRYFGHWLKDGITNELLAADCQLEPLVLTRPPSFHEAGYRALLGLQARPTDYAWIDRLWLLEDWELNRHFISRFERLRERLRAAVGASGQLGSSRIFVSRGATGIGRGLANEAELQGKLAARGFEILEPEKLTAAEMASKLVSARLVVSPEGSANAHALLAMPKGGALLTIIGAQHLNLFPKLVCDTTGLRFGLTIADAVDEERFSQPIDRLLHTIDLMEAAMDS
jgi:capsular polysaccharide biosynthesis protein